MSKRVLTLEDALRRLDGRGLSWLARTLKHEGFTLTPSALGNYKRRLRHPSQPVLAAIKKILSEAEVTRRTRKRGLPGCESPTPTPRDPEVLVEGTQAQVIKQADEIRDSIRERSEE